MFTNVIQLYYKYIERVVTMRRIIMIDTAESAARFGQLVSDNFAVSSAEHESELEEVFENDKPDAVVIDAEYAADRIDEILDSVHEVIHSVSTPVVIVTESNDMERQSELARCGANDVIHLPLCKELLVRRLDSAIPEEGLNDSFGVDELMERVAEGNTERGAYIVQQGHFTSICRFVKRGLERSKKNVQVLLMTLSSHSDEQSDMEMLDTLSSAVKLCLRRGDISSVCNKKQIVILLMDADDDGGHLVANRIVSNFYSECDDDNFEVRYDIRELSHVI